MPRTGLVIALLALAASLAALPPWSEPASAGSTVNLTVDGSQQFQDIDGLGVNINPKNWNDGELIPALDLLADQLGAEIFRVDPFGQSDWEVVNDNSQAGTFNWAYYNDIYESPSFQDLWQTLEYLEQKDVQIMVGVSGLVPSWMGGTAVDPGWEAEWVEMIASLVYYARVVRGIDFTMFSPANETDYGPPEGPSADEASYVDLVHDLFLRLDSLGLSDIRLVGPDVAFLDMDYLDEICADAYLLGKLDHFAFHNYSGNMNQAPGNAVTCGRDAWMTEWSQATTDGFLDNGNQVADEWAFARVMTDYLFNHLSDDDGAGPGEGAEAVLAWDAFDNIHEHNPSGLYSRWGLVAYDLDTGVYTPKDRFFTNAQFFKFISPGSARIGAAESEPNLQVLAFRHAATGRLTLAGQNVGGATLTLNGTISNVPSAPTTLALYRTSSSLDLARQANVPVSSGTFSIQVPPDSFFTLTGTPGVAESTPPSISGVSAAGVTATGASIVWNTNEVADTRVEWGTTASYGQSTVFDAGLVTSHHQKLAGLLPATTYHYRAHSADASGNPSVSSDHTFTTTTAPPTLTVTFDDLAGQDQVLNGQYPAGVIDWGTNAWYHSGPYGLFNTKSIGFNGPSITAATFTLLTPRRLVSIRAHNGASGLATNTTVTLSCPGQPDKRADLVVGEIATIPTGWAGTCSSVTIASTDGWVTNFDDLVFTSGGGAPQGPDNDGDGCSDAAEQQTTPGSEVIGGLRDANDVWDFMDQFVGAPLARDRIVAVGDIGAVVGRFGATGSPSGDPLVPPAGSTGYHTSADRQGSIPGQNPWNLRPPDGVISIGDVGAAVGQFGHSCA
ncbi:MAG: flexitail domain-containing putative surface protein [Dehalococcoidia bacterium]